MVNCGPHNNPENYNRVTGRDGKLRAFCKTCGKFVGYIIIRNEVKQTAREKWKGSDVE
jgi:hypothetical protein